MRSGNFGQPPPPRFITKAVLLSSQNPRPSPPTTVTSFMDGPYIAFSGLDLLSQPASIKLKTRNKSEHDRPDQTKWEFLIDNSNRVIQIVLRNFANLIHLLQLLFEKKIYIRIKISNALLKNIIYKIIRNLSKVLIVVNIDRYIFLGQRVLV